MSLADLKPNTPKVDLGSYVTLIYGVPKVGKTTFYNDITSKHYGDQSKTLLLAFEKGYTAIKGIYAKDIEDWSDFMDTVDELILDKDDLPFEMLGIDTIGLMAKMATDHVVRQRSIADKKRYKSIGDIPHGKGYGEVDNLIIETLQKLQFAGYGITFIGHAKDKKFKSRTGDEYDKTTVNLTDRIRDIFVNQADFIVFIDVEKAVEDGKTVDKRVIHLRSDGDIEAGSRFPNIPDKIDYDADAFLEAFKTAVESAHGGTEKEIEEDVKIQQKEKEEKAKEYIEKEKEDSPEDIHAKIQVIIDGLKKDKDKIDEAKEIVKSHLGKLKYKEINDVDLLNGALEELESKFK